jgi:hypothetical protein
MRRHPHPTARAGMEIAAKRIVAPLHYAAAAPGAACLYGGFDLQRIEGSMNPRTSSAGAKAGNAPPASQLAGTTVRDIEAWWAPASGGSTSAPGCRPTLA